MRFGLIGCGGIGQLRADALREIPSAELTAVSDIDNDRAKSVASGHSSAIESDWRKLIQREDVDAVIVSTPPSLHAEMCIAALNAGKHVLCEKPLVRTVEEGRQILKVAENTKKYLATGFNYRFYPSILKAKELLDEGRIGELDHIRSYAGYTAADHNHEWLHDMSVMGGGALRDNGIHLIDLTRYFLGEVEEVKGLGSEAVWGFDGCEDNGFALLRSTEGKIAVLQASWTEWRGYKFVLDLYGSRGTIRASCFPMTTQIIWSQTRGGKNQTETFYFPKVFFMEHLRSYRWVVVQSFILEFEAFMKAVRGEPSEIATGLDGLRTVEIAASAVQPDSSGGKTDNRTKRVKQKLEATQNDMSVIVVPMVGQTHLTKCLDALRAQSVLPGEMIVPFDDRLGDMANFKTSYPEFRFLKMEGRKTFAELRAYAVRQSSGSIIAITEDHCKPEPDWCANIIQLHTGTDHAAIGGVVEKETPDTALDWAFYFADYLRYSKPLPEGPVHALTDLNVTYKRDALMAIEHVWSQEFHENVVHAALKDYGETLWLSPKIVVLQKRQLGLGQAIQDRYAFGRLFGSTRVASASSFQRLKFILTSVLIPPVIVARVAANIRQKKRWTGEFIRALPALVLISSVWGWGEFLGYVTGRTDATLASHGNKA